MRRLVEMFQVTTTMKLDSIDRKLLDLLQRDCQMQIADLADLVGLSQTPCWRRVQRLKECGIITGNVSLVDRDMVNVGVTVFVSIRTNIHSERWFESFQATVATIPEVTEFYRMSGDVDYLLRVVVPDIRAYDKVYKRLIADTHLFDISSSFAMQEIKYTTALPLSYIP